MEELSQGERSEEVVQSKLEDPTEELEGPTEEQVTSHQATRARKMDDPMVRFALDSLVEQIQETEGMNFYDALTAVDQSGDGELSKVPYVYAERR